jgi:hypothetical protein
MQTFTFGGGTGRRSKLILADVLLYLVENGPGRTEAELAKAIFGPEAYQLRVNQDCNRLASAGEIDRRGAGGPGDLCRYYPAPQRS